MENGHVRVSSSAQGDRERKKERFGTWLFDTVLINIENTTKQIFLAEKIRSGVWPGWQPCLL